MWKNRCADCVCLIEDDDKDWYCDDMSAKCILVDECPYALENIEEEEQNDNIN